MPNRLLLPSGANLSEEWRCENRFASLSPHQIKWKSNGICDSVDGLRISICVGFCCLCCLPGFASNSILPPALICFSLSHCCCCCAMVDWTRTHLPIYLISLSAKKKALLYLAGLIQILHGPSHKSFTHTHRLFVSRKSSFFFLSFLYPALLR